MHGTRGENKAKYRTIGMEALLHELPLATLYYYRKGWTSEKDKGGPSVMRSFQHLNPELAEENLQDF